MIDVLLTGKHWGVATSWEESQMRKVHSTADVERRRLQYY